MGIKENGIEAQRLLFKVQAAVKGDCEIEMTYCPAPDMFHARESLFHLPDGRTVTIRVMVQD